jgi:hypothetical protein
MDIVDQLAEMKVKEYEQKGKELSFELARLTVQAETCDFAFMAIMDDPKMSVEKIADSLNLSVRFVKASISRHKSGRKAAPELGTVACEQILEMRKRGDPKRKWSDERREYYKKDSSLRISEQMKIAEIFVMGTNYSVDRIARLVGLPVSSVEEIKEKLQHK